MDIFFDLDDIVKPLVPRWLELIRSQLGEHLKYEDITSFGRLGDSKYLDLLSSKRFSHEKGDPETNAPEVIQELVDAGHNIYIVSATHSTNIEAKSTWIKSTMPMIPSRNMMWVYQKGLLAGPNRILVDDAIHNLDDWRNNGGTPIAMTRPWNIGWDGYRVEGFLELKELLNEIEWWITPS